MRILPLFFVLILSSTFLTGCFRNDGCDQEPNTAVDQNQLALDVDAIESYLSENNIEAEVHPSGIRYVVKETGTGRKPTLCNQVTVRYEGRLMSDGSVFDSSDRAIAFALNRLITGWQVGIPLIKEGGSITLYIPSSYAYGRKGAGDDIPPNANLIFDIELVAVFN